ncbi:hypothetical protein AMTRI_Chr03g56260 [Amborella trichopoda]
MSRPLDEKESQNSTCQTVKVVEISADNNTSRVTWKIENFSSLDTEKHLSDIFNIGGCKWQLLIYPKGNNVDGLSVYLNVPDAGSLPNGWSRKANVCFCIINQTNGNDSIRKDTIHVFNARETDWGFTSFIPLSDLCPKKGYMLNDTIIVEVEVSVSNVINYSTDSTKTESASKSDMEVILEHEEELQVKNPIRELNKEIKSLQAAKEIVEIRLKSFKQELAMKDLAHRVRELELQANNPKVEEPKSEIKSLQEAIVTFDEEFQGFTKELTVKNVAHHACEMEPHFNNSEIEELKSEIKSLKEAKATVEEELIECKKELAMQEEACHSLELKLQADTPIVAELTNQIQNLQDAKSVVEEELKACREELVTRIEAHHARESEFEAKAAKIEELTKAMKIVVTVKAMVDEELKASKQELAIKDTACHDRELELQTSNSKIEELKNEIKSLQDAKQKVEEELKGYQRELEMGDMKARFKDLEYELAIAKKDGEIKELLASLKFSEKRVQDVKEAAADWRFLTFSASRLEGAQM